MKNKKSISELVITSLVTLLPMEVGLLTWNKLPAQMVSHFDCLKLFQYQTVPLLLCSN